MKKLIPLIVFNLLLTGFMLAQDDILVQVRDAIKTGSSREMVKLLNESVDMTIEGKMKSYSKAQAEFILRDFFKKNPPSSFNIIHKGASKAGLPYAIGEYKSNNNTFRVWIRITKANGKYLVNEVSFIKE